MSTIYGNMRGPDEVRRELREAMEADGVPESVIEARLAGRLGEVRAWRGSGRMSPIGDTPAQVTVEVESVPDFCERIKAEHEAWLDERYGQRSSWRPGDVVVWAT